MEVFKGKATTRMPSFLSPRISLQVLLMNKNFLIFTGVALQCTKEMTSDDNNVPKELIQVNEQAAPDAVTESGYKLTDGIEEVSVEVAENQLGKKPDAMIVEFTVENGEEIELRKENGEPIKVCD